jgi:hypothetical protein
MTPNAQEVFHISVAILEVLTQSKQLGKAHILDIGSPQQVGRCVRFEID